MIIADAGISAGVFDSRTVMRHEDRSRDRVTRYYELELFLEDSGVSYINGVAGEIRRGMLLVAAPNSVRYSILPVKCFYLKLLDTDSEEAALLDGILGVRYLDEEDYERMSALFSRLISAYLGNMRVELKSLRITSVFYEMVYRIRKGALGIVGRESPVPLPAVTAIKEYLDQSFRGKCTLQEIAAHVNLSPNYLQSLFRRTMGVTPAEYVRERRVEEAKRMIVINMSGFAEIAAELGFSSQSHFNKVFLECVGMTPGEYRRHVSESY